jgi:hypothetical protein
MFRFQCLLLTAACLVGSTALADNKPQAEERPLDYARSLGQVDNVMTDIDAANTECLPTEGGGTTCELYAFGSVTPVTPSGVATLCFSQRRTGVTIGAQAAETAGAITAEGTTEKCLGWTFMGVSTHDMIPRASNMRLKGATTYSGRYCTQSVRGAGGGLVYPPCGYGLQTQILTLPADPTDSVTYPITINGVVCTTAALDANSTTAELQAAMVTAINGCAVATVVTAANSTTHVIVTSDIGGLAFTTALGTQPAAPMVLGAAVSVQSANNNECVTVSGAGSVCIVRGDARIAQYETEGTASTYLFGRPAVDNTLVSHPTER